MVKITDKRQESGIRFSEIRKGQAFWSPIGSCFMLKIEEYGCDECGGFTNAVDMATGNVYYIEPTEIVDPCRAEIQIFNC